MYKKKETTATRIYYVSIYESLHYMPQWELKCVYVAIHSVRLLFHLHLYSFFYIYIALLSKNVREERNEAYKNNIDTSISRHCIQYYYYRSYYNKWYCTHAHVHNGCVESIYMSTYKTKQRCVIAIFLSLFSHLLQEAVLQLAILGGQQHWLKLYDTMCIRV